MDAIGTSTKLLWVFVLIYVYSILLFFFSVSIWLHNKFKQLTFVSYIADAIMTVLVLLAGISNLINRIIRGYSICDWNTFFLILSAVLFFMSISSRHKSKNVSNISMNIATALCMIVIIIQNNT